MKRGFLLLIAVVGLSFGTVSAAKDDFPKGDITWIVPMATGGGFDIYSRAVAMPMSKILGVNIGINNMDSAGGRSGTIAIYRARPDAYTIGIINANGLVSLEIIEPSKDYDLDKFVYLGQLSEDLYALHVLANSPFKTIEDLRKASKPVRVASTGIGSSTWSATIIGSDALKIPIQFVTGYKSTADISLALQRGDVDAVILNMSPVIQEIKSGAFKPMVQFQHKRHPLMPAVPTSDEIGAPPELPEAMTVVRLVVAPPGTPKDRSQILEAALLKALKDSELQKWAETSNNPLAPATGTEAARIVSASRSLFAKYKDAFAKHLKK